MLILLIGVLLAMPLVTYALSLSGIIIAAVGFLLTIAASLFNAAMDWFVLRMGALVTGAGASGGVGIGASVDVVWKIVRDLVNLTFIFGLVYVGFKTILDAGTDTKKMLASIIVSALLVNFSLFISKVVIDVSNITAVEIYRAMQIAPDQTAGTNAKDQYIGDVFLARMGIKQLVTLTNTKDEVIAQSAGRKIKFGSDTYLAYIIGASIFILIATFVFFAGAILLAIRFGVLIILMILSPIAFAATVFPAFKAWRDKWWHTLFSQAFFAPAYLFMLYITLQVANGYRSQATKFDGIYDPDLFREGFATMAFFCLTIVLMVASLIIAKQMGAYGAASVLATGKKVSLRVGKNLRGFAGRYTIGAAARGGEMLNDRMERSRGGRFTKALVSTASLGTFTERTRRKVFEAGTKAKFGGQYSFAEDREWARKHGREKQIYDDIEKGEKETARGKANPAAKVDAKLIQALALAIRRRTTKDLEEMQVSLLTNKNIAVHITAEQMRNIRRNENGRFSVDDIAKIAKARTDALGEAALRDPTTELGKVQGPQSLWARGENELRQLPVKEVLTAKDSAGDYPMAPYITPRMIEYIAQEGASDEEIDALRIAVQAELDARVAIAGDPYRAKFAQWVHGNNTYGPGFGLVRI